MEFLQTWLRDFKYNNAIAIGDNTRDSQILAYLEIAYNNISTDYCGYRRDKDGNYSDFWVNQTNNNKAVKFATIHLATVFFNNPDDLQIAQGTVHDDKMLLRILGTLVQYA